MIFRLSLLQVAAGDKNASVFQKAIDFSGIAPQSTGRVSAVSPLQYP